MSLTFIDTSGLPKTATAGHGEVTVIVANRFVVLASGRRVPGIDTVRRAVTAIDLAKLGKVK